MIIPRPVTFLFTLLASALLSLPLGAAAQEAPQPQAKVELTPATIELPAKGEAQAQFILRNKSKSELQNVKLDWFSGTEAVIKADESLELARLAPQAETYWTLHLEQGAGGLTPGNVYFRLSYNTTGDASVPQLLYATLIVNLRQSDEVSKVVEVVPRTTSTQLNEQRPGQVFLVINNKSNLPIQVGAIKARGPVFITGTPDLAGLPQEREGFIKIEARDSISIPVQIKVTDAVRPGKHLILFQVPVEWGPKEHVQTANVIAQQELDVGVLGESELLTALGLPSFLILPGFLMLITFRLLAKPDSADQSLVLKNAANPALWIGAITLSGVMAFLYPYGTKLFGGVSRNYLIGYGLRDVIYVWVASILLGLLAYLLVRFVRYLRRYWFMPAATDNPAPLLRKLHRQGLGVSLYQLTVKISAQDKSLFMLEERRDNQETFWVGPYINIAWLPAASPEFKQRVADQLEAEGSAKSLAKLIEEGERNQFLSASWDVTTGLAGPRLVKKAEVTSDPQTKAVIAKQV